MRKPALLLLFYLTLPVSCNRDHTENAIMEPEHKIVVYQVFTRLFGNTNTTNKPWGTIQENGAGKFQLTALHNPLERAS